MVRKRLIQEAVRLLCLVGLVTLLKGPARISLGSISSSSATGMLTFIEAEFDEAGLNGADALTVSPDGCHVYVVSDGDDAVAVFSRDAATGTLTFVEMEQDAVGGVDGLASAESVAISPDGRHVYVAAELDHAVAVFSRDASTGALAFEGVHKDSDPGVSGLGGAYSVAVSPSGSHVYVAGLWDDSVAIFERDEVSGALTFVEMHQDPSSGGSAEGLDGAKSVAVSPDGNNVYAIGGNDYAVVVFDRNPDGTLNYREMHQDGVGEVDGLYDAQAVIVSPDGRHVYATGRDDDAVAVFGRNASTGALTFVEMQQDGAGEVDGLEGAEGIAISADGNHVYVAGDLDHALAVFRRNASTGRLTFVEVLRDEEGGVDGLRGPQSVAVTPDGSHVYVADDDKDAVSVFGRNESTGELAFVQAQWKADGLDGAVSVTVSQDGSHVYVTGNLDDAVAVFRRDEATGALTFVEMHQDPSSGGSAEGLDGARSAALSPDGTHLYVVGHEDDALAVLSRDDVTGGLSYVGVVRDGDGGGEIDGLDGAQSVAISPDGSRVYVAGSIDDAVVVFDRDESTGELDFGQVVKDGYTSIDSLDGAYSVAVSPDGINFYVAGYYDDAVTVFRWTAGALGYEGVVKDGQDDVDGLDGANSIAVSPDGNYVYVASREDDGIAIFWRNPSSGLLTYRGMVQDGVDGVDGLNGARSVVVDPNGSYVYAVGQWDDALAVFRQDASTGALTFLEVHKDTDPGVDGLNTADGVAVSLDGRHVYVAGYDDDAVAAFARRLFVYLPAVLRTCP